MARNPLGHWFQRVSVVLAVLLFFGACTEPEGLQEPLQAVPPPEASGSDELSAKVPEQVNKSHAVVPGKATADKPVLSAPSSASAEKITVNLLKTYPHLRSHLGQSLLSQPNRHFVLAGLREAKQSTTSWQPLIIAVYRMDPSDHKWVSDQTMSRISLWAGEASDRNRIEAIDYSVQGRREASLRYLIRSNTADFQVKMVLAAGRLEIRFLDTTGRSFVPAIPLRLRGYIGAQSVGESAEFGAVRGSFRLVRYTGKNASALTSFRPFTVKEHLGETTVWPQRHATEPVRTFQEGYDLFFDKELGALLSFENALVKCQSGNRSTKPTGIVSSDVALFKACLQSLPDSVVTFEVSPDDAGRGQSPYPLFISGERKVPELYLPLRDPIDLRLPANSSYTYSSDRSRASWSNAAPLVSTPGVVQKISLPPRERGKLRIELGENNGPGIAIIQRLGMPKGNSGLLNWEDRPNSFRLHDHILLIKTWPINLELLEGEYDIRLVRGRDGTFCTLRASIQGNQTSRLRCPRKLPDLEPENKVGWLAADLATWVGFEYDMFRWLLGADWLAHELTAMHLGEEIAPVLNRDQAIVNKITFANENLGLKISALGLGDEVLKAWQAHENERDLGLDSNPLAQGEPIEAAKRFIAYMRKEAPGSFIEFGCPESFLSFERYLDLVQTLAPDGLQIYGCTIGVGQEELFRWVGQVSQSVGRRFVMTSASSLGLLDYEVHFPRMMVLGRKDVSTYSGMELIEAMHQGAYTLSSGATVTIEGAKRPQGSRRDLILSIDLRLLDTTRAWQLIIYSEHGEIHRRPLYDTNSRVQKIPLTISIPNDTKWLRAEVRGASRSTATSLLFERGDGLHLASTNFIAIEALNF